MDQKKRYSIMNRHLIAGKMQLNVMDWSAGQVITLFLDEINDTPLSEGLKQFIEKETASKKQKDSELR